MGKIVFFLLWGFSSFSENPEPGTAIKNGLGLHKAIYYGDIKRVKELISAGWNIEKPNKWGQKPLNIAVSQNRIKIMKLLIQKGVNLQIRNSKGDTILHTFIKKKNLTDQRKLEVIAYLLKQNGINVDAKNREGETPLHLSALDGLTEIVKLLIANGADVSAEDKYGRTAFHLAYSQGRVETMETLKQLDLFNQSGASMKLVSCRASFKN